MVVGSCFAILRQKTTIFRTEKTMLWVCFFSSDGKYWFRFIYLSALEIKGPFQRKVVVKLGGGGGGREKKMVENTLSF